MYVKTESVAHPTCTLQYNGEQHRAAASGGKELTYQASAGGSSLGSVLEGNPWVPGQCLRE